MSLSIHAVTVPVYTRALTQLAAMLDKGAAFAEARKIEPRVLLEMRLAPDMFPLARQVQIACDFAKGSVARLAGQEVPKWADDEASFDELKARIDKTLAFIASVPAAELEQAPSRTISMMMRGENRSFEALPYLLQMALPNFWFHVTTAYAILRHAGVELGKRDFIGPV